MRRIGLVGCVKRKRNTPTPARDLYLSTLFAGRRAFVERTCDEWWILSAAHGLVAPDRMLDPYDVTLNDASDAERRGWSAEVMAQIDTLVAPRTGDVVEIHAGSHYRNHGLVAALAQRGVTVDIPTEGMRIGQQLALYSSVTTGPLDPGPLSVRPPVQTSTRMWAPTPASDLSNDLDRFYRLLRRANDRSGGPRRLADSRRASGWPERGVYFFFEPGELRSDGTNPRVVRIGTHALRPSRSTLWSRLSAHQGQRGGATPGGGNHRGSVFRKHVGAALLATGEWDLRISATWGVGSTATREIRLDEYPLELAVSRYIGAMDVVWIGIDDPPEVGTDRGVVEAGAIGLLSEARAQGVDPSSAPWLGHRSKAEAIRRSGLWNVEHVGGGYDSKFLEVMEYWIDRTTR